MWRIHMLRLAYLLMAGVMGPFVWQQVLFQIEPWPAPRIIAKSMLASQRADEKSALQQARDAERREKRKAMHAGGGGARRRGGKRR